MVAFMWRNQKLILKTKVTSKTNSTHTRSVSEGTHTRGIYPEEVEQYQDFPDKGPDFKKKVHAEVFWGGPKKITGKN